MSKLKTLYDKIESEHTESLLLFLIFIGLLGVYGLRLWINQDNWSTLVHQEYNFSIDYPTNWKYYTYGEWGNKGSHDEKALIVANEIVFFGVKSKSVAIHWKEFDTPTLDDMDVWGKSLPSIRNGGKGVFSEFEEVQIGENDYLTFKRIFEHKSGSNVLIHYYVIMEERAYLLEFFLNDEYYMDETEPIFDQILSSFEITE